MILGRNDEVLGIIPARGGSKRVPHKNVRKLCGKPLIAYTIEAAIQSQRVSRLIVSTDDNEIACIANQFGAEVPFLRPVALAQDDTPGIAPVLHAVHWLEAHEGYQSEYVLLLQPTSPFRTSQDIESAIELAFEKQADGVVSVSPVDQHPYWMKTLTTSGHLTDFLSTAKPYLRRQDLPSVYILNGALYLVRRSVLLEQQTFFTDRTYAHVMSPERSLDIDTPWDLYVADLILKDRMQRENR